MEIKTGSRSATIGFKAEFSPAVTKSGNIRIPISYRFADLEISGGGFSGYWGRQGISTSSLSWWDRVTAADVVGEHLSPRVGLEIGSSGYAVIPSVQHYRIVSRTFYGVDCSGCVNSSKVYSREILENGVSTRLDVIKKVGEEDGILRGIGFYVESLGLKTWRFGLVLRWKVR